jgi:hypothetical protein
MTTRRKFLLLSGAALATPLLPGLASAQQWPSRSIRAIVPFSAGSTIDIIGRIVLEPLSAALGQPIVVGEPGWRGRHHRDGRRRQRGTQRLHDPDTRLCAFGGTRRHVDRALAHEVDRSAGQKNAHLPLA